MTEAQNFISFLKLRQLTQLQINCTFFSYCRRIWDDYIRICHESKSLFGMTFLQLKQSILGVEMRLTWGLNPLANEFQPQKYINRVPAATVAPVSISSVQCTVATNVPHPQHLQYYSKGRPRPTIIAAVDPSGVHYPAAPYHPEMATGLLPPPHPVIPNQHTVINISSGCSN